MKRTVSLLAASALFCAACVVLNGCTSAPEDTSDEGLINVRGGAGVQAALKELETKGLATLSGVVSYDGDIPGRPTVSGVEAHADRSVCVMGDVSDPTWVIDPQTRGVANVIVWVSPPPGFFFKKPDDARKTWQDVVEIKQPFCAFIPHVVALYPQTYNGQDYVPTGQVLTAINNAPIGHNFKLAGSSDKNPAQGGTLGTGKSQTFSNIRLDNRELSMNCDIHKWMTGYAMTFDHPYAAVTDKDGRFEIKNVPAGATVTLKAWHEDLKRFDPAVEGGTKLTLKDGDAKKLNFSVRKK